MECLPDCTIVADGHDASLTRDRATWRAIVETIRAERPK